MLLLKPKCRLSTAEDPRPLLTISGDPGDFDIEFTLTDEDSGIDAGSIKIEDDQDPHVLSFSNIGETATPTIYGATVFNSGC